MTVQERERLDELSAEHEAICQAAAERGKFLVQLPTNRSLTNEELIGLLREEKISIKENPRRLELVREITRILAPEILPQFPAPIELPNGYEAGLDSNIRRLESEFPQQSH